MKRTRDLLTGDLNQRLDALTSEVTASRELNRSEGIAQIHLKLLYKQLAAAGQLPDLTEVGFKVFSQADEDGILLFLFAVLGSRSRTVVELCAGDGTECNTANLIVHHGWHGLLVDGNEENVAKGRSFFEDSSHTYVYPPRFVHAWVTRGSVNELLVKNGFSGEIDLLSLDLDGVEYWIWDSLDVISPRVVVVEYQDILGPTRSWTVPYSDDFHADAYPMTDGMPNFAGASLSALVKLGRRKGYRLVGVNRYGYNAFFLRDDLGLDVLREIEVEECFSHPKVQWGMSHRFPTVEALPWVEV